MTTANHIKRRTAKEQVTVRLREQIAVGDLEPGARLSLRSVSEAFGVSMTPVREAFETLAAEGLLKIDAFRGARVSSLSADEYEEIYLVRAGLEALAHRLGAERISDAGCDELAECLMNMKIAASKGDVVTFVQHDRQFHEIIYAASGRETLRQRLMSLRVAAERYTRAVLKLPTGGMVDTVNSHKEIVDACRMRDGRKAEQLICEDLRLTYESFASACAQAEGSSV